MAQVGPDEAASNLSNWTGKITTPPEWMKSQSIDTIWTVGFGTLALLTLFVYFLPRAASNRAVVEARSTDTNSSDPEFISLQTAMKLAYEHLRESRSIYASAAESMSSPSKNETRADAILHWLAWLIVPKLDLYGESPPSTKREIVSPRIVKGGAFASGLSQLCSRDSSHGPLFSNLMVRKQDLNKVVESLAAATKLEQPDDAHGADFDAGFQRATFTRNPTKESAVLRLTQLRGTGVVIRNSAARVTVPSELHEWTRNVKAWMDDVIDALRAVNDVDAEWFKTLDVVPPARIQVPVRLSSSVDASIFQANYNQHDYRLVRLERLLIKYGVAYEAPKQ